MASLKSVKAKAAEMGLDVVKYRGKGGGYSIIDGAKVWRGSNWESTLTGMKQKLEAAKPIEGGWQMQYY